MLGTFMATGDINFSAMVKGPERGAVRTGNTRCLLKLIVRQTTKFGRIKVGLGIFFDQFYSIVLGLPGGLRLAGNGKVFVSGASCRKNQIAVAIKARGKIAGRILSNSLSALFFAIVNINVPVAFYLASKGNVAIVLRKGGCHTFADNLLFL